MNGFDRNFGCVKSAAIAGLLAVPAIIMAVDHGHASALCTIDKVDWMSANQHALLANFETAALPFETTARRQPDRVVAAAFDNLSQRRLPIAFDASDRLRGTVSGNYQCRKIQLDEDAGYSYPYFRCRIEDDGEGLFQVRKTSGSQLFTGYLHRVTTNEDAQNPAGHLVYQGMFHAGGDDPKAWDKDDRDAEVGCMTGRADGSLVLEVPPQNGYQSHVLWEFRKR